MLAELTLLAASCAPNIAPTTLEALVKHESTGNAYAIGINKGKRLAAQPTDLESAVAIVEQLIKDGTDFDAGLGQINVRNWAWLGLTSETVFEPCTNLQAAQTVLAECYERASRKFGDEQQALRAALSCYNTGNFDRGFQNGYVNKVLAQAGIKVPALKPSATQTRQPTTATTTETRNPKGNDGFTRNRAIDGFTKNRTDGSLPQPELPEATTENSDSSAYVVSAVTPTR